MDLLLTRDPLSAAVAVVLRKYGGVCRALAWVGWVALATVGFILGGALGARLRPWVEPHVVATLMLSAPSGGALVGRHLGRRAAEAHARRHWSAWCAAAARCNGVEARAVMELLEHVRPTPGGG